MGSINTGSQVINYTFQEPATAGNFNRIFRDTIKVGFYNGGLISIIGSNQIQISPFVCMIRSNDAGQDKAVHLTTTATVTLSTPNAPNGDYTIYLTYTYLPNLTNYADFNIRLTSASPVQNEIRFGRVVNNGSGVAITVSYSNRTRGNVDVAVSDQLTADVDPTQGYHVGNRDFQDKRYVLKTGSGPFDVQILNSSDGSQPSSITASNTAVRTYSLQDRSGTLALSYETFQVGMIVDSLFPITTSANSPFLDIALSDQTPGLTTRILNASGAGSFPLLVPALRAVQMNIAGATSFAITGYTQITPGAVAKLQFDTAGANGVTNTAFINALLEDNLYHGNTFVNYRALTLPLAIGSIPAGDYPISAIDAITKTISINTTITSGAGSGNVQFFPYRIGATNGVGSTTTARWYVVDNSVTQSLSNNTIQATPLLRVRDSLQLHKHTNNTHAHTTTGQFVTNNTGVALTAPVGGALGLSVNPSTNNVVVVMGDPTDSGTGGGTPRTSTVTRGRGIIVYKYLYAGVYSP